MPLQCVIRCLLLCKVLHFNLVDKERGWGKEVNRFGDLPSVVVFLKNLR